MAIAVIGRATFGIGEDFVGLGELLELVLGGRIVGVDVRVQLAGELSEGFLDLSLVGFARNAQHVVGIAWLC